MFRQTAVLAFIATLGAAAPALAQAPAAPAGAPVNNDLRCIILAGLLGQSQDVNARPLAPLMTFYYLGRYNARGAPGALAPALAAQGKILQATMTSPADVNAAGQKCLQAFQANGQALEAAMRANRPPGAPPPAAPAPK